MLNLSAGPGLCPSQDRGPGLSAIIPPEKSIPPASGCEEGNASCRWAGGCVFPWSQAHEEPRTPAGALGQDVNQTGGRHMLDVSSACEIPEDKAHLFPPGQQTSITC